MASFHPKPLLKVTAKNHIEVRAQVSNRVLQRSFVEGPEGSKRAYRGTSLIRPPPLLGSLNRNLPGSYGGPKGGRRFLMSKEPLYLDHSSHEKLGPSGEIAMTGIRMLLEPISGESLWII